MNNKIGEFLLREFKGLLASLLVLKFFIMF